MTQPDITYFAMLARFANGELVDADDLRAAGDQAGIRLAEVDQHIAVADEYMKLQWAEREQHVVAHIIAQVDRLIANINEATQRLIDAASISRTDRPPLRQAVARRRELRERHPNIAQAVDALA